LNLARTSAKQAGRAMRPARGALSSLPSARTRGRLPQSPPPDHIPERRCRYRIGNSNLTSSGCHSGVTDWRRVHRLRHVWKPGELPIHTNKSQCVELRMQSSSHASYVGVRSTSVALWIRKVTRASLDGTLFTCFTNWGGNWGIPEAATSSAAAASTNDPIRALTIVRGSNQPGVW